MDIGALQLVRGIVLPDHRDPVVAEPRGRAAWGQIVHLPQPTERIVDHARHAREPGEQVLAGISERIGPRVGQVAACIVGQCNAACAGQLVAAVDRVGPVDIVEPVERIGIVRLCGLRQLPRGVVGKAASVVGRCPGRSPQSTTAAPQDRTPPPGLRRWRTSPRSARLARCSRNPDIILDSEKMYSKAHTRWK